VAPNFLRHSVVTLEPITTVSLLILRATAGTAIARLSHRNSVRPSVRPCVTRVIQSKTVQARITKSSPSAAREDSSFRNRKAFP